MTKQVIYCIVSIVLFFSVSSCGSYDCEESEGLRICTISLTPSEIDTIILRKYTKGSAFTNLIDTLILDSTNALFQFPFTNKDTSFLGVLKPEVLIKSKYDYEIYIPAVNRLLKITDINEPQQKMKRGFFSTDKTYCMNAIVSFQQDGKIINIISYNNQIFIHR
ncbi:MAG: hypothetical protein ABIR15_20085 [Chitinophagaceae bacterium]